MGLHEYLVSLEIEREDYPFYSLVMALVRKADLDNMARLRVVFPETVKELEKRYNARAGVLLDDLPTKARFDVSNENGQGYVEGRLGVFNYAFVSGTYFQPNDSERVGKVFDDTRLEVMNSSGKWESFRRLAEKED